MKRLLGLGALAAAGYAVWRALEARKVDTGVTWRPQPFPYPPAPTAPVAPAAADQAEVEPVTGAEAGPAWVGADGGSCPTSHPVKAKLASGIFHVPGGANYERTRADRCYTTADAAAADGLRASKV
jgi:hypothetical protein